MRKMARAEVGLLAVTVIVASGGIGIALGILMTHSHQQSQKAIPEKIKQSQPVPLVPNAQPSAKNKQETAAKPAPTPAPKYNCAPLEATERELYETGIASTQTHYREMAQIDPKNIELYTWEYNTDVGTAYSVYVSALAQAHCMPEIPEPSSNLSL